MPSGDDEPLASLLGTALGMEWHQAGTLPELIAAVPDPMLHKELQQHLEETREHIHNVEGMFEALGEEPHALVDPLLEALRTDQRALQKRTSGVPRMLTVVAGMAATEHLEIARYEVLRALAEARGSAKAVELIVRTLDQERQALKLICESMHRILGQSGVEPELIGAARGLPG